MTSATTKVIMNFSPVLPRQLTTQITHSLTTHRKIGTECNVIYQMAQLMSIRVQELPWTARTTYGHHRLSQDPVRICKAGIQLVPSQIHLHPCQSMLRASYIFQFIDNYSLILCCRIEKGCNIPFVKWYIYTTHLHSTSSHMTGVPAPIHLPTYSSNARVDVPSGSSK